MINGFVPMDADQKIRSKWHTRETIDAFLESGETCVGRDYGEDMPKAYGAFRAYVKSSGVPVTVFKRGTVVGLLRR